jgi:hypothetical protein
LCPGQRSIEAKLGTPVPKPGKSVAPPAWAGSGDPNNTGINARAPGPASGGHSPWSGYRRETREGGTQWKDPFGQWRYSASGEIVTSVSGVTPRLQEHSYTHRRNVELIDNMIANQPRES